MDLIKESNSLNNKSLEDLLKIIGENTSPNLFKESMLRIAQLYFDGLVESGRGYEDEKVQKEQKFAFDFWMKELKEVVGCYYDERKKISTEKVLKNFGKCEEIILKYGSRDETNVRHLVGYENEVRASFFDVFEKMKNEKFDLIIPIASGGFEPGALFSYYLGLESIFPIRYSQIRHKDEEVRVPFYVDHNYMNNLIGGKNVILSEDVICSGKTILGVVNWIKKFNPENIFLYVVGNSKSDLNFSGFCSFEDSCNFYKLKC